MKSGIYKITNTVNGKSYIGKSNNIKDRWRHHKRTLNKGIHYNKYLQRSWEKYGASAFEFEILEYCDDAEIVEKEIAWIEKHNTFNNGYNLTLGGEGIAGHRMSEEQKELIKNVHLGKKLTPDHVDKIRKYRTGKKYSEEQKKKMGELHRGELNGTAKLSDEQVLQIKKLLNSKSMPSKEVAKIFNVSKQTICLINTGKTWRHIIV